MPTEDDRKLFVAGLPDSFTEDVLRQVFEATGGTVTDVSLPKDRMTGRPRGFGFVTLSSAEEAAQARQALDGQIHGGRAISVRAFQADGSRRSEGPLRGADRGDRGSSDRTLYVGNLPYDTTEAQLVELLTRAGAGAVLRVHLPVGPDGRSRGYGFVTLGSAQAATDAIGSLQNAELKGRRLQVKIAQPRGERPDRPPPSGGGDGVYRRPSGGGPGFAPPDPGGSYRTQAQEGFPPDDSRRALPAGGRRRAERPEKGDKKKKAAGRTDRAEEGPRKMHGGRTAKDWDDWDED
jgi:RNA recognition motif-containing protein